MAKRGGRGVSREKVAMEMKEVHTNIPSTVRRAKHFGPKGKEGMLRAIAFSKARKGTPTRRTRSA